MIEDSLINCKDAAEFLGISPRTLERYVAEAQIPHIQLPRRGDRGPKSKAQNLLQASIPATP